MSNEESATPAHGAVVEVLHGQRIVDRHRWLEDGASPEVRAWTSAQNDKTRAYLQGPERDKLRARLDELLSIGSVGVPVVTTDRSSGKPLRRYFYVRRDGKQEQPVVYVREGLHGAERPLLDARALSEDETAAIDWWYPSRDGRLIAYGLSLGGTEKSTLHVRDVPSGTDLADEIPRTRMSSIAWLPDGRGFYYTREPAPGSVPKDEESYHRKVYAHQLGRHWKHDELVFPPPNLPRAMTEFPSVTLSPSGRWLLVRLAQGWAKSSLFVLDRQAPSKGFTTAVDGVDALFEPLVHERDGRATLLVRSNEGAPNYRVLATDLTQPERSHWRELVAEGGDPLADMESVGDALYLSYSHRAHTRLEQRTLDGKLVGAVPLPGMGSASIPTGEADGEEAFFGYESFTQPPTILRVETRDHRATSTFAEVAAQVHTSDYAVDQVEATSKDGTRITAFVVRRKDVPRDGSAPGMLYGYGGFNIGLQPTFGRAVHVWLQRGGVYVVANLRGGSEYGEAWHRAGMLEKKQNVFDDAIAIAETLVAERWVAKHRLAVVGGSNGGLLVGALITQRPELFAAAVSAVPLLDMLRYHRFLLARLWVAEYGSADDPAQFAFLRAYSPYHNVTDGTAYPAVLLLTGEGDTRVDPLHARKMAARLAEATSSGKPVLLRVETRAGHGAGKPRQLQLEELADQYAFLFRELGVQP